MPFMDEPPGAKMSTTAVSVYGRALRSLRSFTNSTLNKEPKWRHTGGDLTTGYHPTTY
jgi:hydrogenase small subunit